MKILVFGNADMKPGFIRAGNQHGHHVLYTDRLPSVDETLSFSPDAVILMIQRPASRIQDCLAAIYHACTARLFLLFELHENGVCCFRHLERREAMKMMLYGVTEEEFESSRKQYDLHIHSSDFYLFMWELDKTALVDYPVNKSIHYFLHALRQEDFLLILEENQGGEIIFSDISFAYSL